MTDAEVMSTAIVAVLFFGKNGSSAESVGRNIGILVSTG
jgi:hypothetical protein